MKPTARLSGSWWIALDRDGATAEALRHLSRFATSDYSLRTTNRCDSTNLFPPAKKRYSTQRPAYVADQNRDLQ